MALNYFYDGQLRRYIEQLQRVFSNFEIFLGKDAHGSDRFRRVPCVYGDSDRMAQHIIRSNSENTLLPVPFFGVYETNIQPDPNRRQNPNHIDKRRVTERKFNEELNQYTDEVGMKYTVERFMPIPYNLTVNADLWYTQTEHKLQIAEQIMTLFNDDINLQTGTNPLDWSSLTVMKMTDISWNSRGVPTGVDDGLRITTFTFEVPIWINPPSLVKRQKVIETIITDIHTNNLSDHDLSSVRNSWEGILNINPDTIDQIFDPSNNAGRVIITPGFHYVSVDGNELTLLGPDQEEIDQDTGDVFDWSIFLAQYGELQENISLIRLRPVEDIEDVTSDYIGRIKFHPTDKNKLIWSVDLETIPLDTEDPIDAIIDPQRNAPGEDLPNPVAGTRYLIVESLSDAPIWTGLSADENDIIEYNGATWRLSFDASAATGKAFTTNKFTGKKLEYDNTTDEWTIIPDGIWSPGFWRIVL